MNYEELALTWENQTSQSELPLEKVVKHQLPQTKLQKALSEYKWSSIIEITLTALWLVWLVKFGVQHVGELSFFIPCFILIAISVYSLILETYKLYLHLSIKHHFSIVIAQTKIERLRFLELFDIYSLYLIIPLFFMPFVIVAFKGLLQVNLFQNGLGITELISLSLGCLVIAVIMVWLLKKYDMKKLNDSIEFLKEINDIKGPN